jgi:Na+-transporting NADH:ubiquinone oxidoreductase subunit NqrA
VQELIEQQTTTVRTDQQERRGMAGRIYDSNGVLNDDRTRNAVIADYRRTTDTIAEATANLRRDANESYASVIGAVKGNRERTEQLETSTTVVQRNTEAISQSTARYSRLYRADREQSAENGADHDLQREGIAISLTDAKRNLSDSATVTAELARNFRDIEANVVKMKERQKEMEKPQPKQDRGMNFGF